MHKTRLDQYLASQHQHYSRTQIKKLIEDGFVLVDGQKRKPSFLLAGGERIEMIRRAPEIPKAEAEEIPIDVLYEDEDLIVINKAPGMVVHPAPGHFHGTLVNAILHHLGGSHVGAQLIAPLQQRPGIVHRLDKGTSGVMVVTKNEQTQRNLAAQFKDRKVEKFYQALVFGLFKEKGGTIDKPIGRDAIHRRKFSSRTKHARRAVTHYEVAERFDGLALLTLKLETGRTHQIRVHLSENRHPIVGDVVYGAIGRPLLHAWRLAFFHPVKKEKMLFEAPLAKDFLSILKCLEGTQ